MPPVTYIGVKDSDVLYLLPAKSSAENTLSPRVKECIEHSSNRKYVRRIRGCGSEADVDAIVLSMEVPPRCLLTGWVFGNSEKDVDILLGDDSREDKFISGAHFAIGFNQNSGVLMLTNYSTSGTFIRSEMDGDTNDSNIGLRRLFGNDPSSILERRTEIILAGYHFMAIIPRNSNDQKYQALLIAELKSPFNGYMTPITPPEGGSPIHHGDYSIRNIIRKATSFNHADIFVAVRISTGDKFVAKCFLKRENYKTKEIDFFRLLKSWKHNNVISLEDILETNQSTYLVLPASPRGDLSQHDYRQWPELQKSHTALQILAGAKFLHQSGIFHRDIKPQNLLLFAEHPVNIKIADLGSATSEETANDMVGTENFAPPEILLGSSPVSRPSSNPSSRYYRNSLVDSWSIGVVLLTFYNPIEDYRKIQCRGDGYHRILEMVASNCARSELELPRLIAGTVLIDPQRRLTIAQCFEQCQALWERLSESLEPPILIQRTVRNPSAPLSDLAPTLDLPTELSYFDPNATPPPGSPNTAVADSMDTSLATIEGGDALSNSIYESLHIRASPAPDVEEGSGKDAKVQKT
ncbi:hypothetical protein TWF481_003009 [Arthrobotrys musiformis]|uniref:non-specific serine/threonine protein kinase n=1 Tax=Arthrobotrys musiformis TaxID=47236 RepID=A0AAV9VTY0_9PEZI